MDGWSGEDTPQTVMTTRAPAVLTKEMIAGLEGAQQDSTPALDHSTRQPFLKVSQNCENDWLGKKSRRPALIRVQT